MVNWNVGKEVVELGLTQENFREYFNKLTKSKFDKTVISFIENNNIKGLFFYFVYLIDNCSFGSADEKQNEKDQKRLGNLFSGSNQCFVISLTELLGGEYFLDDDDTVKRFEKLIIPTIRKIKLQKLSKLY